MNRFDVRSFDKYNPHEEDEEGVLKSVAEIEALVDQEIRLGIPAERIIVAGFSQGGAMTLALGIITKHRLAGMIVLSSYIPIRERLKFVSSYIVAFLQILKRSAAQNKACGGCSYFPGAWDSRSPPQIHSEQ